MILYFAYFLLLKQMCIVNADLVCRDVSDSVFEFCPQSCKDTAERVSSLEEQVRQLQKIVSAGERIDTKCRYSDIAADCGELYANGTRQSGVYMISPDGRCPFSVYCDMADGGWTVMQRRIDGAVNFYRTWDEYVDGFGDIDGENWLGLEKIHRLTKEGYEIYFDIENYDGTRDYAHYKSFIVHDATTLYQMNVDAFGYEGSIDELFSNHNDQKFSTFDRDNDAHNTVSCVQNHNGGGWWYKDCYTLGNLNSIFGNKAHNGLNYHNKKQYVPVKTVSIKIKAKAGFC